MNKELLPRVVVSAHAIDRLSERCLHVWESEGRSYGVGLMTFFITKSREAYSMLLKQLSDSPIDVNSCKITYGQVTYVFNTDSGVTTLVTAYMSENKLTF